MIKFSKECFLELFKDPLFYAFIIFLLLSYIYVEWIEKYSAEILLLFISMALVIEGVCNIIKNKRK